MNPGRVLFLFSLFAVQTVLAAPDEPAKSPLGPPVFGTANLLETAGGLLLVLAVFVGLAWLVRRIGHLPTTTKGMVKILGGANLGPRERVVVIEVEQTRLVLGVAPGRVSALHVAPANRQMDTEFARTLDRQLEGKTP